jgi:hypothetical protein
MSAYRVSPSVVWSVGRVNLTVSDGRGAVRTLEYPEAAVWDLISRGYAFDAVVELTRHIACLDPAPAAAVVRSAIEQWLAAGLLIEES